MDPNVAFFFSFTYFTYKPLNKLFYLSLLVQSALLKYLLARLPTLAKHIYQPMCDYHTHPHSCSLHLSWHFDTFWTIYAVTPIKHTPKQRPITPLALSVLPVHAFNFVEQIFQLSRFYLSNVNHSHCFNLYQNTTTSYKAGNKTIKYVPISLKFACEITPPTWKQFISHHCCEIALERNVPRAIFLLGRPPVATCSRTDCPLSSGDVSFQSDFT